MAVHVEAGLDSAGLMAALSGRGLVPGPNGRLWIALASDLAEAGLEDVDEAARRQGLAWLLVAPCGVTPAAGPLFVPGQTPCWRCLQRRLRGNRLPGERSATVLLERAARAAHRWIETGTCELAGSFVTRGVDGFEKHPVMPLADCPYCVGLPRRIVESSWSGLLEPADWYHGDGLVHVADSATSRRLYPRPGGGFLVGNPLAVNGRGLTRADARRKCRWEAAERESLLYRADAATERASLSELGSEAIDPRAVLLYSDRQYQQRERLRKKKSDIQWVPDPFDAEQMLDWTPVTHARTGARRWVPAALCYFGYLDPAMDADSNGCAAGASHEDAAVRAILELIERDAFAIWWYNRSRRPALAWSSVASAESEAVRSLCRKWRRRCWLLDVTSDIGVPVVVAISADADGRHIQIGSAAAFTRRAAAAGAAMEMAGHVVRFRQRDAGSIDSEISRWWKRASLGQHGYLLPRGSTAPEGEKAPRRDSRVGRLVDAIGAKGIEVYLKDQTRPDLGVPVMRAIAPGLRHWWARLAPGRLYREVRAEGGLNPVSYFS